MTEEQISTISRLVDFYDQTKTLFQINKRDEVIADAVDTLVFLAKYNFVPKLDRASFYELCHTILENTKSGDNINAISLMLKCEWDYSQEEQDFWDDNKNAVNRKVKLERIFIVSEKEAHRLKTNPQIKNHINLELDSQYIHSYIVEKGRLQTTYPELLSQIGNGFILVNLTSDKIALLDKIPESGKRAKPIADEESLGSLLCTFNSIKELSQPIKKYLDEKIDSFKKETPWVFNVILNIAKSTESLDILGLDVLCFIIADIAFEQNSITDFDKRSIAKTFSNYYCIKSKYGRNISAIPNVFSSETRRKDFIRLYKEILINNPLQAILKY